MNKPLKMIERELFHVAATNRKVYGPHSRLRGYREQIYGDCSKIHGDCFGLYSDCSNLTGDCTGLHGRCTEVEGDLDQIPPQERKRHPDLYYWIRHW